MNSRQKLLVLTFAVLVGGKSAVVFADHHAAGVKFLRFQAGDTVAYGVLEGQRVRRLQGDLFGHWSLTEATYSLEEVKILAPSVPTKVIALAGNYLDHIGDRTPPAYPEPFLKTTASVLRHGGKVVQPPGTAAVHYEAEVVVVVGKRARNVSVEDALDYVLGITCGNDISARVWQRGDVQWWRAKGSNTFSPCGPFIASGINFGNLDMTLRVNGEVRQKTNTKNMIHDIAQTVSFISNHCTLEPGDLIFTGTPGKTKGMNPGDVVEVEIENVGVLRNQVVSRDTGPVKYLRFSYFGETSYGILEGKHVRRIEGDLYGEWEKTDTLYMLDDVTILTPSTPSQVFALAGNYRDHIGDSEPPKYPQPFMKLPSCLQRHEGAVLQPKGHEPVHYEAEVVIVVGKEAKDVSVESALDYVLGITCGNDISARAWQRGDVQWWRAKASDTFGPCGPYIASGIDYSDLDMELRVNGEVRQKTSTKNMIHNIAETVSFISAHATLKPGDLIFTGTPGKTKGMKPGDVVEVEIEGVGVLRNKIVNK